jgi:hypothetical protein
VKRELDPVGELREGAEQRHSGIVELVVHALLREYLDGHVVLQLLEEGVFDCLLDVVGKQFLLLIGHGAPLKPS